MKYIMDEYENKIINMENVVKIFLDKDGHRCGASNSIVAEFTNGGYCLLGSYSTTANAMEVMNEMKKRIRYDLFIMPIEYESINCKILSKGGYTAP